MQDLTIMTARNRWLLPEGVEEILPDEAFKLETLRRRILDLYASWSYDLVITPLIEYLDSLLVGSSHDLDLHTFKITDQLTGRMMGVRADITPQVARIDAHCLGRRQGAGHLPVRLCYADHVLHTLPRGLLASRVPFRIGAEMFGHAGTGCDIELICLMHETLQASCIENVHLVLGHVGLFRGLVRACGMSAQAERDLFDALQRKAFGEIDELLAQHVTDAGIRSLLLQLSRLSGDEGVLEEALQVFKEAPQAAVRALEELAAIARGVRQRLPGVSLGFDLCELRGYEYHTGIVFAAYTPGYGRAVAQGGRYNDIGAAFGSARPASGFDADLEVLARLSTESFVRRMAVSAPADSDPQLHALIASLREQGERVLMDLTDTAPAAGEFGVLGCDRRIVRHGAQWLVQSVK
jgi:ATP phosphoribosyltransferase regulatory subunit